MKIREYFVPHLVEDLKGQGKNKVTAHMNGDISMERDNTAAETSKQIRNRKTTTHTEKISENGSSRNLKFTAIYQPTNHSTVRGKWLFLDLIDIKVVVLSMFRSLPWYLWLLGVIALISDIIFKTHLVSIFRWYFFSRNIGIHFKSFNGLLSGVFFEKMVVIQKISNLLTHSSQPPQEESQIRLSNIADPEVNRTIPSSVLLKLVRIKMTS